MFAIRNFERSNATIAVFLSKHWKHAIGHTEMEFCCANKNIRDRSDVEHGKLFQFRKQRYVFSTTNRMISDDFAPPIYVGAKVVVTKTISQKIVRRFAEASGDWNPIHFPSDEFESARKCSDNSRNTENESHKFSKEKDQVPIVHGALLNGIVSGVIGTELPGPGTKVISQTLNFPAALPVGSLVEVHLEVIGCKKREVKVYYKVISSDDGVIVMDGYARLMVPKGRISKSTAI